MSRRFTPALRGRPPKTDSRRFHLAALSAVVSPRSQLELATVANDLLPKSMRVSQPTFGKWMHRNLDRLATRSLVIHEPASLDLSIAWLLFNPDPSREQALVHRLRGDPLVSRVERWVGEVNVAAEVIAASDDQLNDVIERWEPHVVHRSVERHERTGEVLANIARGPRR